MITSKNSSTIEFDTPKQVATVRGVDEFQAKIDSRVSRWSMMTESIYTKAIEAFRKGNQQYFEVMSNPDHLKEVEKKFKTEGFKVQIFTCRGLKAIRAYY